MLAKKIKRTLGNDVYHDIIQGIFARIRQLERATDDNTAV